MNDRVGRAADRAVNHDRVLERLLGQDLRHAKVLVDHFDDASPRHPREHFPARVDGGDRGVRRQSHAERLDHRRHRRRRAHRHAMARRARHARFRFDHVAFGHFTGFQHLREFPHVRARTDVLSAELAVQHRTARHADRRQITRCSAHQQ